MLLYLGQWPLEAIHIGRAAQVRMFLKANPRFSKALAVTLVLLLLQVIIAPIPSLGGRYQGEVYGDFSASGRLWAHQQGEFDWVYLFAGSLPGGGESVITVDVWNASSFSIAAEPKDFPDGADNYTIPGGHFRLETRSDSFQCNLERLDVEYEISDFLGTYNGRENAYWDRCHASHVTGHGLLSTRAFRNDLLPADFPYQEIHIGNATMFIDDVPVRTGYMHIDVPPGEQATVSIDASGYLDVSSDLTVFIDGGLSIEHFAVSRGVGHARYSTFRAEGSSISVRTLRTSSVYSHWSDVYEPWVIEVRTPRGVDVELGHPEGLALGVTLLLVISASVTAYIGRWHIAGAIRRTLSRGK